MNPVVEAGLVRGRHPMPTDLFVWDAAVDDPMDMLGLYKHAVAWLQEHVGFRITTGLALDGADEHDIPVWRGRSDLRLYVTGLSQALCAVIKACAQFGIRLTLLHYDKETGGYAEQRMF